MGFDRKDAVVICVSPGINGKWDVSKKGLEVPLASFDEKEDAYAYATDLSRSNEDAAVLVEDRDGFSLLPLQAADGSHDQGGRPRGSAG